MKRRNFIQTTGLSLAAVLINKPLFSFANAAADELINFPDKIIARVGVQEIELMTKDSKTWASQEIMVSLVNTGKSIQVYVEAPSSPLSNISLIWRTPFGGSAKVLNDHWERTYGDASWHKQNPAEILPWYFFETNGNATNGFGVKTGTNSFAFWKIDHRKLSLTLDTTTGGIGVRLGNRKLLAVEIVTMKGKETESAFEAAKRFTTIMCDKARMPKQPVYGINDWYFSYGNNSDKLIIEHTELMAPLAEGLSNRPFSVIDAGWFSYAPAFQNDCCWGDNMDKTNFKFSDMGLLAEKIKKIGMRPGIWTRPLCGSYKDSKALTLPMIKGREDNKPVLDPSIPENLERIKNYFKLYTQWGYELMKFDFTTFDVFGLWGFDMLKNKTMTQDNWSMYDTSKTNAEIIKNMYQTIREAAGETYIIGCNTFSHLSAGLFELNRIGDDTSGNEWERTLKMGVNTLAFRGIHQGSFYAADADCVGLTNKVAWEKNKQWMELVAKSGTPLFISAQSDAIGAKQKETIKTCFALASQNLPVGEPLDWMQTAFPKKWKLNNQTETFDW